ncbi:hypothetical protein F2Q68_00043196 [Brassica cretica]|uniref:Uncharacterized protein n=1 Tax=Brassica cretica TaxID=69181 RepID=A0A8S9LNL1_BRACR|nr:hypothetical protein F2Q68_00043196 [Brassica cretica]
MAMGLSPECAFKHRLVLTKVMLSSVKSGKMKDHLINLFLKCLVSRETFCEMNVLFGYGISGADSDAVSLPCRQRKIIAVNFLPLNGKKDSETGQWKFILDNDSPLLHLKDGFSPETESNGPVPSPKIFLRKWAFLRSIWQRPRVSLPPFPIKKDAALLLSHSETEAKLYREFSETENPSRRALSLFSLSPPPRRSLSPRRRTLSLSPRRRHVVVVVTGSQPSLILVPDPDLG